MADSYLTQRDIDDYGPDLINLVQRGAAHALAPTVQGLAAENAALQQRLAREARYRLDQQVAAEIPDYQTIDQDPAWHAYLREIDPLSGRARQQLLNEAVAQGIPNRVIAFFRGFQRESGGTQAASGRQASGRRPPPAACCLAELAAWRDRPVCSQARTQPSPSTATGWG
jgi:hypothetical protein